MALSCNPGAADRRRADDRARRHRAGADPRPHPQAAARLSARPIVFITHDMGVIAEIADRVHGDVCRPHRRARRQARSLQRARATPTPAGLLNSIPPLDGRAAAAPQLDPGMPPSLLALPRAAPSARAARYRFEKCGERPRLSGSGGHETACFLSPEAAQPLSGRLLLRGHVMSGAPAPLLEAVGSASTSVGGACRRAGADRARRRQRLAAGHGRARPSAWSANPAAASRRSAAAWCGSTTSRPASCGSRARTSRGIAARELRPIAPTSMQMVFQDPYASLNPRRRVRDLVAEPLRVHRQLGETAEIADRVRELLEPGRPAPRSARALPARVLRRPAPAHRHRPRHRARAAADRRRRAGLGARRLRSRRRSSTCSPICRSGSISPTSSSPTISAWSARSRTASR